MFKTGYSSILPKENLPKAGLLKTSQQEIWFGLKVLLTERLNPAAQALLIQILSLSLVFMSQYWARRNGFTLSWHMTFALQALCALSLSWFFSMARWWHGIHVAFPLLVGVMLEYPISQAYYLFGLVLTSTLYWSTFRSQVPFFPSNRSVRLLIYDLLAKKDPVRMMDIGSGLGGLILQLSKDLPHSTFSGIEIAPLPWALSFLRSKICKTSAHFHYGDYRKLNFADYDVIYAYLSPVVMSAVWQKAVQEMTPGSLLISNEFAINDQPADFTLQANPQSPMLYIWRM